MLLALLLKTAGQPLVLVGKLLVNRKFRFFVDLCIISPVRASGKSLTRRFLRCLGGNVGHLFPGRIILLAPNLARPRPAALPGAPP